MTYTIIPRTAIGLDPVVRNSDTSPRPALKGCRWLTLHWTGVNVSYGDVGDTAAEIRAIEKYAAGAGKGNEYNYVIGQDDDNIIHEYAGTYQAAHSAGENDQAIGVLFLNGTNEPVTLRQIDKARWLCSLLRYVGVLEAAAEVRGHRDMPDAGTQCPGDLIERAAPVIALPWQTPPAPPTPPTPPTPPRTVLLTRVRPGDGWLSIARRCYAGDPTAGVAQLRKANRDTLPRAGQLVNVPGRAS